MRAYRKFWVVLLVMALASPLGLYLPRIMQAGSAWGEWGLEEIRQRIGYAPAGMERTANIWKAPIPEYTLPGSQNAPLSRVSLSYILSAFLGIAACGGTAYGLTRWLAGRRGKGRA